MLLEIIPSITHSIALDGAMDLNTFSSLRFQPSFVLSKPLVKAFVALTSVLMVENASVTCKLLRPKLVVVCPWCRFSYIDSKDTVF